MSDMTMSELAASLGLNQSTVSRALDPSKSHLVAEATRLRVLRAAAEARFTPNPSAVGLRRRKTLTVGLLVPDLRNGTLVDVVRAITGVLDQNDQTALIAESMDDPQRTGRLLERFRARRVDAVINLAALESDRPALTQLARSVPVVLAVRRLDGIGLPNVAGDDLHGGWLVGHHLADLGHTRIAQIAGPLQSGTFSLRAHGFALACAERGVEVIAASAAHATVAEGRTALSGILASPHSRPTALFAHNDELAIGAFECLREMGLRCPADLSVVGYNNTPLGRDLAVPLTSVQWPATDVGRRAGYVALQLIDGAPATDSVELFEPELVQRTSSAPPGSEGRAVWR